MKAATLRSYIALHTWVGLVAGFGLFIAFFAGAITIFHEELGEWEVRGARVAAMQPSANAQQLVDAVLRAQPKAAEHFGLILPSEHEPVLRLQWDEHHQDGSETEHAWRLDAHGALTDAKPESELSHFLYRLHYTAGLPAAAGIYVLGIVCVLYGLALASGVVIYAPGFLKDLFALRIGKNLKRMWQDAHNAVGILSLPFHLMYAWSSAILCLGILLMAPFQYLVFDGKLLDLIQSDIYASAPVKPAGAAAPLLPAPQLMQIVQREAPQMRIGQMYYKHAGDANGQVEVYGQTHEGTLNAMSVVVLNASSGKVLRVLQPAQFSAGTTFLRGLQTLHFGSFGGYAVKWVYFILGLAGAFLFYSGNLLWIEARRKRSGAQTRSSRWMAKFTVGFCLGSVAGVGAAFLVNKLLALPAGALPAWEEGAYFAVFFGAIVWAGLRPPARAAHELLLLCAALALALPFAQWRQSGSDPFSALWQGRGIVSGVNLVALGFAWAFWRMARATLRRGRAGDPASVWSLQAPPRTPEAEAQAA
ncbi:PepSY domain-containing protein [Massilia sp. YIM B04103]|uniref:PepSY-associated TM helix domain-containing protein n=1 Tax=Massilia sp. YIM B04103 TaxID=2963106 RepID=UPI00210B7F53|nr:PepSY-associated TM helix domain-containing protein [Massilia sp. YIM B04103]